MGCLLRDNQGCLLKAQARFMFYAPILVYEAPTLRDGLKAALDAGLSHIHIKGDNWIVI